jgi:hypothetical protein
MLQVQPTHNPTTTRTKAKDETKPADAEVKQWTMKRPNEASIGHRAKAQETEAELKPPKLIPHT